MLQVLHTQLRRLGAKGRPDRPTDAPTGPPWRPPLYASPQPTPTAHARPVRPAVAVPLATVTVWTDDVIISPCAQHHAGWPSWTDPAIQELRAERVVHARGASIGYGRLKRRRRHGRTSGLCAPGDGDLAPPWGPAQLLRSHASVFLCVFPCSRVPSPRRRRHLRGSAHGHPRGGGRRARS